MTTSAYRPASAVRIAGTIALCAAGVSWICDSLALAGAAESPQQKAFVNEVAQRLLAATEPAHGMSWPPAIAIVVNDEPNAFSRLKANEQGADVPEVVVYSGVLEKVVCDRPDRLAFLLGHELSHLTCGHVLRKTGDLSEFVRCSAGRDQEFEADLKGLELALKAGYSLPSCLSFLHRFIELKDYSTFEGLLVDHPSWRERLARLDQEHARLWRASAVFHEGNQLLLMQQFDAAVDCFQSVTADFPKCREGWCNLGFAQLMQYYDNLTADDLRSLNGQLVVGGFRRRSDILDSETQGPSEDVWRDAVAALSTALAIDPNFAAANGALATAYLLAPQPNERAKAAEYFELAATQAAAATDADLESASQLHLAVAINSAVADLIAGNTARASDKLDRAARELDTAQVKVPSDSYLWSVLLYNRALLAAVNSQPEARAQAIAAWESYLQTALASHWWELGYSKYVDLCNEHKRMAHSRDSFQKSRRRSLREVASLELPGGAALFLTQRWQEVQSRLGIPELDQVVHGTELRRANYSKLGLGLIIGDDEVLAISLTSAAAPDIVLRETALDADLRRLKVGMGTEDLDNILPGVPEYGYFIDHTVNYRVYRDVGLAVRVHQGQIVEVILAQFPKPRS